MPSFRDGDADGVISSSGSSSKEEEKDKKVEALLSDLENQVFEVKSELRGTMEDAQEASKSVEATSRAIKEASTCIEGVKMSTVRIHRSVNRLQEALFEAQTAMSKAILELCGDDWRKYPKLFTIVPTTRQNMSWTD